MISYAFSLGARYGFTQHIFYKKFDHFSLQIRQNALKKTVVSCDVNEGITLGTKLKIPIFTLNLSITYKVGFWYFRSSCIRDTVSKKTYQNFHHKRLVSPEVNT